MAMIAELFSLIKTTYGGLNATVTWSNVCVYCGIGVTSWLCYFLFIRPFIHPLRKLPGMTYYPLIGNLGTLRKGEAMEVSIQMIKEYGPVMRYYFFLGMERVIVGHPDVMKHILVTNCKNYIKPPSRMKLVRLFLGDGLVLLEGDEHAAHKRLMSPSFNNTSIKKMLVTFELYTRQLTESWSNNVPKDNSLTQIDIHHDITRTTLDIIGKTAFGYNFNSLSQPDHPVTKSFHNVLGGGGGFNWLFVIPYFWKLPVSQARQVNRTLGIINSTVDNIVTEKRDMVNKGEDISKITNDVLGMMMMARDESTGNGLSNIELRDEVKTLMSAGHETTAVGMAWCLLMLAQHQDVQNKLRQEINHVIPSRDTPLTWELLEKLEYCSNVIKETLRLYPPVPMTLRQAVNDDVLMDKHFIPKGTILLLSQGAMMRLPEHFKDPETFKPERFEDEQTNEDMYKFLPFLLGPRMCLGYKFALMEMKVMLSIMVRQLEFHVVPGTSFKRQNRLTMRPSPSLVLNVKTVEE